MAVTSDRTKTEISALLLDFGCVISKSLFEVMGTVERGLGLASGALSWRGPLDPGTDPLWRAVEAKRISERRYWEERAAEVGALRGERWSPKDLIARACDIVGSDWIRPEVEAMLDDARARGIRTGILSNELESLHGRAWMDTVPVLNKVDVIVDGTHTKILKPDKRAFEFAIEAIGANPEATLFVDDQIRNIQGAVATGIPAIHFDIRRPRQMVEEIRAALLLPIL